MDFSAMMVVIKLVPPSSNLLKDVIRLGDANSQFLGMYPFSAYERDAGKGKIICAVNEQEQLLGYILYRTARGRAVIQHCCVAENSRRKRIGETLLAELKKRTSALFGIELHCAREFEAAKFWEANGFVAFGEKEGRGADRRPLTRFVFDHRNADLFSSQQAPVSGERLLVVIDTNVAYDWQESFRPTATESAALLADWLAGEIDIRVTDHAFADADRCPEIALRERRKAFLRGLLKVNEDREVAAKILARLHELLRLSSRLSSEVDIKHIAAAIAAEADAFVTHDSELLKNRELLEGEFGIVMCSPAELIGRLDEDLQAAKYQPVRLAGSAVFTRSLSSADLEPVSRTFLDSACGERIREFQSVIKEHIAHPQHSSIQIVEWPTGVPVGLIAFDRQNREVLRVPLMRFRESRVTSVLLRHVATMLVKAASASESKTIVVTEPRLTSAGEAALQSAGFSTSESGWLRFVPTGLQTRSSLALWFESVALKQLADSCLRLTAEKVRQFCLSATEARIEQMLWPVRLKEAGLPGFIVPIQPRWAIHLFDEGLAGQTLYGSDPVLMFNTENVYYKSARPQVVSAPARVLWYVSKDGVSDGVQEIRACSSVLEVEIGSAKELFGRYRRLGVYEWRDLMESTGKDPQGRLMAIRFGVTECFKRPVPLESINSVLVRLGRKMPPLSTAYELPDGAFEEIYALGANPDSD